MHDGSIVLYCPALRLKLGELAGVMELDDAVARHVLPRFVVPPLSDRKDEKQYELFESGYSVPDVGGMLSRHWLRRRAFVDVSYLIKECTAEKSAEWLPPIFARATSLGVRAIPLVRLGDLDPSLIAAFKKALPSSEKLKLGITVLSGDLVDPQEFGDKLRGLLADLGVEFADCAVIADFADADFSEVELVSPIITSTMEALQDLGPWQLIIFQGTYYPEKNPAVDGQTVVWPRNEWHAWHGAVKFDAATAEYFIFGDFAADSAKMNFAKGRAAPIRHYRYSTPSDWLIVRGADTGTAETIMADVCTRIVESGLFAGRDFSRADKYIHATAFRQETPGNPTTWRQVNTTHHITRVVVDVAKVKGIAIAPLRSTPAWHQNPLFG